MDKVSGKQSLRLYVPGPLAAGASIVLSPDQVNYLKNARRMRDGDPVHAFNGKDGVWSAYVHGIRGKGTVTLTVDDQLSAQPESTVGLHLVFAPLKPAKMELLIKGVTELGVKKLSPVQTEYTAVTSINEEKYRAYAVAAAQQSERCDVPAIDPLSSLADMLERWNPEVPLFFCYERGGRPILDALAENYKDNPEISLLMGPEGGFSDLEVEKITRYDFVHCVSLGAMVLRAETAALAAVACTQGFLNQST